jgi:hypothetical protein
VACLQALNMSRQACRDYALARSWENSARQFIGHMSRIAAGPYEGSQLRSAVTATASS